MSDGDTPNETEEAKMARAKWKVHFAGQDQCLSSATHNLISSYYDSLIEFPPFFD